MTRFHLILFFAVLALGGAQAIAGDERVEFTTPIAKSEFENSAMSEKSPRANQTDRRFLAKVSSWNARPADVQALSLPLTQIQVGLREFSVFAGTAEISAGAEFAGFSDSGTVSVGGFSQSDSRSIYWAAFNLGTTLRLTKDTYFTPLISVEAAPGLLATKDSLLGPGFSRFNTPLKGLAGLEFSLGRKSAWLLESHVFYSVNPHALSGSGQGDRLSGLGLGLGFEYLWSRI